MYGTTFPSLWLLAATIVRAAPPPPTPAPPNCAPPPASAFPPDALPPALVTALNVSLPEPYCFESGDPGVRRADLELCRAAIDDLTHRTLPDLFKTQTFYNGPEEDPPGLYKVPVYELVGAVDQDSCGITLGTGESDVTDDFKLIDVVIAAQKIVNDCLQYSKEGLGGALGVGTSQDPSGIVNKGFVVAVNGITGEESDRRFEAGAPGLRLSRTTF